MALRYGMNETSHGASLFPIAPASAPPMYAMPMACPRFRRYQFEMMIWCGIGPDRE